jgi:hypothetical protein
MALYKNPQFLSLSQHAAFDLFHTPGSLAPNSGIYRCTVCGHEAVSTEGNPLPPQGSHVHHSWQGNIRWQLIVAPS